MPAIISTIVYGSFIVSTLSTTLSNISANDTIRRGGNEIDNSKTTFMEKLNYFITDYAFLLVPIYNVYKSIYKNRIKKTPSEYTSERKAMLKNRNLLRSIEVKKENTPKIEAKVVKKDDTPKKEEQVVKKEPTRQLTKEEKLYVMKNELNAMTKRYKEVESARSLPYKDRKELYDKIMSYRKEIVSLEQSIQRENELNELRKQREELRRIKESNKIKELKQ